MKLELSLFLELSETLRYSTDGWRPGTGIIEDTQQWVKDKSNEGTTGYSCISIQLVYNVLESSYNQQFQTNKVFFYSFKISMPSNLVSTRVVVKCSMLLLPNTFGNTLGAGITVEPCLCSKDIRDTDIRIRGGGVSGRYVLIFNLCVFTVKVNKYKNDENIKQQ